MKQILSHQGQLRTENALAAPRLTLSSHTPAKPLGAPSLSSCRTYLSPGTKKVSPKELPTWKCKHLPWVWMKLKKGNLSW